MHNKRQKIYISGPMTGLENYNYPAFLEAETQLRKAGFKNIENPARNPEQESWEDYMKEAIKQMLKCDQVATLKDWGDSNGSRKEVEIALLLKIPVLPLEDFLEKALPLCASAGMHQTQEVKL